MFEKLFVIILVTHLSMLWLVMWWVILVDRDDRVMKLLCALGVGWLHVADVEVPVGRR